jgi:hypothetical protein
VSRIRSKIAGIQQKYGQDTKDYQNFSRTVMGQGGDTYNYVVEAQVPVLSKPCENQLTPSVTPCYTLKHSFDNSVKEIYSSSIGNHVFTDNRGNNPEQDVWGAWFAKRHNCEMGDAFEPQTEDILDMVGFDLQPAELIPADQVLAAADHLRSIGDMQSTIAMMNRSNINRFVWTVDPTTNRWVCHAEFE